MVRLFWIIAFPTLLLLFILVWGKLKYPNIRLNMRKANNLKPKDFGNEAKFLFHRLQVTEDKLASGAYTDAYLDELRQQTLSASF